MVLKGFLKNTPLAMRLLVALLLALIFGGQIIAQTTITPSWDPSLCLIYGTEDDVFLEVEQMMGAEVPTLTFRELTSTSTLDLYIEAIETVPPSIAVINDDGIKALVIFYRPQEGTYSERLQINKGSEDWLWYWGRDMQP